MCGSEIVEAGLTAGLRVAREVFADRAYQADGKLVPRHLPGAVHMEVSLVVRQALDMVTQGFVTAVSGERIPVSADTICVHGDGPHALAFVSTMRQALNEAGVGFSSLGGR